jgi:hypothetical protein
MASRRSKISRWAEAASLVGVVLLPVLVGIGEISLVAGALTAAALIMIDLITGWIDLITG